MSCGRAQSLVLVLHHQLHIPGQLELGVSWQQTFVWPFDNHQSQSTFAVNIEKSHHLYENKKEIFVHIPFYTSYLFIMHFITEKLIMQFITEKYNHTIIPFPMVSVKKSLLLHISHFL